MQTATAIGPCYTIEGWSSLDQAYVGGAFETKDSLEKFRASKKFSGCVSSFIPEGNSRNIIVFKACNTEEYFKKLDDWSGDYEFTGRD